MSLCPIHIYIYPSIQIFPDIQYFQLCPYAYVHITMYPYMYAYIWIHEYEYLLQIWACFCFRRAWYRSRGEWGCQERSDGGWPDRGGIICGNWKSITTKQQTQNIVTTKPWTNIGKHRKSFGRAWGSIEKHKTNHPSLKDNSNVLKSTEKHRQACKSIEQASTKHPKVLNKNRKALKKHATSIEKALESIDEHWKSLNNTLTKCWKR